jgi:hypothetical protein
VLSSSLRPSWSGSAGSPTYGTGSNAVMCTSVVDYVAEDGRRAADEPFGSDHFAAGLRGWPSFEPRTCLAGRPAKSLRAIVVMINSAIAPSTMAVCCRGEKSDHRFFFRRDLPSIAVSASSLFIGGHSAR